ncbi:hypothetical protein H5410_006648 [Solanum commersonii]|uniref:AB hydrolase-1 domain-containing protein n=1 Tax=Solanum commersonii TaxID=4109 RepID=A0A9J6A9Q0_SOLCO|nr:hypothetical protein H5410_006648 [Solanum commersonii]
MITKPKEKFHKGLKMNPIKKQGRHFVLVHGACHGGWYWYKLKPLLEVAGHKVTTLYLSASGIDLRKIEELHTFHDYTLPLMESLPQEEKVILVGHSLGGMNLGLVMEKYQQKIYVAVFLAAFMPDSIHMSSYVLDQDANNELVGQWTPNLYHMVPLKSLCHPYFLGPSSWLTIFINYALLRGGSIGVWGATPPQNFDGNSIYT